MHPQRRSIRWPWRGHRAASRWEEDDDDANRYWPGGLGRFWLRAGLRQLGFAQVSVLPYFFYCFNSFLLFPVLFFLFDIQICFADLKLRNYCPSISGLYLAPLLVL
jgi:hypothetical protein